MQMKRQVSCCFLLNYWPGSPPLPSTCMMVFTVSTGVRRMRKAPAVRLATPVCAPMGKFSVMLKEASIARVPAFAKQSPETNRKDQMKKKTDNETENNRKQPTKTCKRSLNQSRQQTTIETQNTTLLIEQLQCCARITAITISEREREKHVR